MSFQGKGETSIMGSGSGSQSRICANTAHSCDFSPYAHANVSSIVSLTNMCLLESPDKWCCRRVEGDRFWSGKDIWESREGLHKSGDHPLCAVNCFQLEVSSFEHITLFCRQCICNHPKKWGCLVCLFILGNCSEFCIDSRRSTPWK